MDSRLRGNDGEFFGNDGEWREWWGNLCGNDGECFAEMTGSFAGMAGKPLREWWEPMTAW